MPIGYNKNYGGATLHVDISDLEDTIDEMRKIMTVDRFEEMLRRTFNDAGKKVRTIMRKEVPKEYMVTAAWVGSKVGWPQRDTRRRIGVIIPIKGERGTIGGRFKKSFAKGRPKKGQKRPIYASIVREKKSKMPETFPHQGYQPGFIGPNGVMFTRKYPDRRLPIVRVVGLGVPQMPINRSEEDVQGEIHKVIENRLPHHFKVLFKK